MSLQVEDLEVDKVYKVLDKDFWMIGRITQVLNSVDSNEVTKRGFATFISKELHLKTNSKWCFIDKTRTIEPANYGEIRWLDYCISVGEFVPYKDCKFKPDDYSIY